MSEVNHFRRVTLIWLVATVVATPLIVIFFAPIVPPGGGTVESSGQVVDNTVLFGIATPFALAVLVFFGYAFVVFREREPAAALEGPAIRGHAGAQLWWMIITITTVLFLATYASYRTFVNGAGGGQGPTPAAVPSTPGQPTLTVQVIAQQWEFTYRYPKYGGIETSELYLPEHTEIRFNVTSLDVVHSFWAYQLGVKADANPDVNNVAFVQTRGRLTFNVRCAELCGVWHGYMYGTGHVISKPQFASWIAQQRVADAPIIKSLPPYNLTYNPGPTRRGG